MGDNRNGSSHIDGKCWYCLCHNGNVIPDYSNSQGLCVFSWVKCNDNGSTVAHATATINNTKDTITFKVNNVYPNYHPSISFGLVNQNCTPGSYQH